MGRHGVDHQHIQPRPKVSGGLVRRHPPVLLRGVGAYLYGTGVNVGGQLRRGRAVSGFDNDGLVLAAQLGDGGSSLGHIAVQRAWRRAGGDAQRVGQNLRGEGVVRVSIGGRREGLAVGGGMPCVPQARQQAVGEAGFTGGGGAGD